MSLTEDFELQIESTCEGKRILWNHNVRIYDEKPTAFRASFRQRTRWAQGHWFVAFKNTGKLFRALFQKKIRFSEFFSTFLYMYSLTPYVILMFQLAMVVGLFKHRKQNQWVKTEHKIHDKDDMTVNFDVAAPEPEAEAAAEEETVSCEENAAAR